MPPVNIDSRPDSTGRFTRVTFDPVLATFTGMRLMHRTATGLSEMYSLPIAAGQHPAFSIFFRRFNLPHPARNGGGAGAAHYFVTGRKSPNVRPTGDGGWSVAYGAVPAEMVHASYEQLPSHDPMRVTLTLRPAADAGWVDMDLHFVWPHEIASPDPVHAWEPIVGFPRLHLDEARLGAYRLLDPSGLLRDPRRVDIEPPLDVPMPVQFTSLYYEGRNAATGINNVSGVVLMGTDEDGHHKLLRFARPAANPDGSRPPARLETAIRAPMFLDANRAFVHPPEWSLSGDDRAGLGWRGARMKWRVRAFRELGAVRDQPMDWHDVAALYRDWARTRTATIFRKHPTGRTANAPMDAMAPFTVVTQYALEGDADPSAGAAVAAALETHPIAVGDPDIPGSAGEPLPTLLDRVRRSLAIDGAWLEAQIWGVEPGGYYRYLGGWPPRSNLIRNDHDRFYRAMQQLMAAKIVPLMTTDPLLPNFRRMRFRGHLRLVSGTWRPMIPGPFHSRVVAGLAGRVQTVDGGNNRVWIPLPAELAQLEPHRKRTDLGGFGHETEALTLFNALEQYLVCPTPALADMYLTRWLRRGTRNPGGVLDHGVRLVEFMKHHLAHSGCFHVGHAHLPAATAEYAGAIGHGPWYARRLEVLLKRTHALGVAAYPAFALSNEHCFAEVLVPVIDEFYDHRGSSFSVWAGDSRSLQLRGQGAPVDGAGIPVQHFVYSQLVVQKGNILDNDNLVQPGYRESRRPGTDGRPTEMLDPGLDTAALPDVRGWVAKAEAYAARALDPAGTHPGLAPVGYVTDAGGSKYPYTYSRAVQDVANLRSRIFRLGAAGVRGERIQLPAAWYVRPSDYNDEAIAMGVRAAQMQMAFAPFFRRGWMLGQTQIVAGNRPVQAWRLARRNFADVGELRKATGYVAAKDPLKKGLSDAISRRTDIVPLPGQQAALEESREIVRLTTDQVQHMVWQMRRPDGALETLYVFANVGNTAAAGFEFRFTRGVPPNAALRGRTVRFDGTVPGGKLVAAGYAVSPGATLRPILAARTFLAIHVQPA